MKLQRTGLRLWSVTILAAGALALACGDSSDTPKPTPPPAPEPTPAPEPEPAAVPEPAATGAVDPIAGHADYQTYCASCHGIAGAGDGPVAATLDPKPAAHNDGNFMNALTDDYLVKVIKEGGQAVGKSPMMAPWGGVLSDDQIRNVVAFIRTLADPPYTP